MAKKKGTIAVLMGGISSEREISLKSGKAISKGLRDGGYDVIDVDVTSPDFDIPSGVDAVFVALHGTFGEDGGVQRILEERGIKYTGSNSESSRLAFDKVLTRERLQKCGVPVAQGEVLLKADELTIDFPVVVKPPSEGSSVGCHLVFGKKEWKTSFADTLQYSGSVLVEKYIPGRELTVGIVGTKVLPVVEVRPANGWYDYDSKYVSGDTEYSVPAVLPDKLTKQCQKIAKETFRVLGASGFGRVDFRLSPAGELFVLELNSIPGFTESSLLPKAAEEAGIGFSELCCRIVKLAHL